MRGISARSLEGVLSAVESAQDSADLGTQLFGVVSLLDANPALRRVLTDPSTESDAKAGLASRVLGSQVGPDAKRWRAYRFSLDHHESTGAIQG